MQLTHEQYILTIRDMVAQRANEDDRAKLQRVKLAYGFGIGGGLRGVTIYSQWQNGHGPDDLEPFVEICASGEESIVQLAGTTVHELAHVVAGHGAGHSKVWKDTCTRLGLRRVKAAGTNYTWSMFEPTLRELITMLGEPSDGKPQNNHMRVKLGKRKGTVGPCTAGIGTRGGRSRGAGSGSRMRKYTCGCGQIIRAATETLDATHNACGSHFALSV